jgi:hypothetical protein
MTTGKEVNVKMKKMYYVWNGYYVEHQGTKESCEEFIRNAKYMFGTTGLSIVVQKNGRYVPA